jgi:hypothetical protein
MLPRIADITPTQTKYLTFLDALRARGFKGDLNPDYANRVVQATDNSIYQLLPQGVVYPKDLDDLVLLAKLSSEDRFQDISLSPRGESDWRSRLRQRCAGPGTEAGRRGADCPTPLQSQAEDPRRAQAATLHASLDRRTVLCVVAMEAPSVSSLGALRLELPPFRAARLHRDAA